MILAQLAHFASHTVNSLALFQEETVSFSPMGLWNHMGWLARCVAIILFIESIWSLAVMIDRWKLPRRPTGRWLPFVLRLVRQGERPTSRQRDFLPLLLPNWPVE